MGRKKEKIFQELEIEGIAAEGKCITKHDGAVIFVKDVAPGDVVDIKVSRKRKNYFEGFPIKFHAYSNKRIKPFCEHFGTCGGCKWQHIDYQEQLKYKQQQVIDNLQRIGKVEIGEFRDIVPSEETRFYRNKLEYTFTNKRWLTKEQIDSGDEFNRNGVGFHMPGRFDLILDLESCWLQNDLSNKVRLALKEFAISKDLSFYDLKEHQGLFRNLIIRTSSTGETMVIVQFGEADEKRIPEIMEFLKTKFPEITSLQYIVNTKKNETFGDQEVITYNGKEHILEQMEGLKFKIGPKSFYQTNSSQAYRLYQIAREFADLQGNEVVYDLYTGTGTIANFVAKNAKSVVGVEYVPEAIEDAKENSKLNNIKNTSFYAGDMKDILSDQFIRENGKPDVIITDPPRAGMHQDVVDMLNRIKADKIVYVSCNPATQARDINLLSENYDLQIVQPVDMFPHTHHVENVVLLELR